LKVKGDDGMLLGVEDHFAKEAPIFASKVSASQTLRTWHIEDSEGHTVSCVLQVKDLRVEGLGCKVKEDDGTLFGLERHFANEDPILASKVCLPDPTF